MTLTAELAAMFGTPLYVYDVGEVRRSVAALRATLPHPHRQLYSLKANPHPSVVEAAAACGCGAEVSSADEFTAAVQAGVDPSAILLTGPGKPDALLAAALAGGCRWVSVESVSEARRLGEAARGVGASVRVLARVNLPEPPKSARLAIAGGPSKFGIDLDDLLSGVALDAIAQAGDVDGVHLFASTNVWDGDSLAANIVGAVEAAARVAAHPAVAGGLRTVDLGGGFPAAYATPAPGGLPDVAAPVSAALDAAFPRWREGAPEVVFEAGRAVAASCGTLVTRVVEVKRSAGKTFVVLDAGVNHLGGMSGLRRLPPIAPRPVVAAGDDEEAGEVVVCGPLCTPLDSWGAVRLPPVSPGDILTIPNVGAYGLTASLVLFLGHDLPVEVVVDGDEVVGASRLRVARGDP